MSQQNRTTFLYRRRADVLACRWLVIWVLFALVAPLKAAPGLHVGPGGDVLLDGAPTRCIGVNYFDCFYRLLLHNDDALDANFAKLEAHHVPFARFMAGGYWAKDMAMYRDDRAEYFRRFHRVIESAGRHHIGLIPSFFLAFQTVPDLVGEPCDQWGNPASKTHAFMREYTREVVGRYHDSPAIWAWEFGNEFNLSTDLPASVGGGRPPVSVANGTPTTRSSRDEMTSDMAAVAIKAFGEEVRKIDSHRMILSGGSIPRAGASHLRSAHNFDRDTPAEQAERLLAENPPPIDGITVHIYEADDLARLPTLVKVAKEAGRPTIVEEFGVKAGTPDEQKQFASMLDVVVQSGAPLAAVWVYDLPNQVNEWSITYENDRAYQLLAIEAVNARLMRAAGK